MGFVPLLKLILLTPRLSAPFFTYFIFSFKADDLTSDGRLTDVQKRPYGYAQYEVNQEESEHNEVDRMKKGADSTDEVMHV